MRGTYSAGNRIGEYVVLEDDCRHGAYCEVYKAQRHKKKGSPVAVKVLRHGCDESYLRREVAALSRLTGHPNIVTLVESNVSHDIPHVVMPYVHKTLADYHTLADYRPPDVATALSLMTGVLEGIKHAHAHGVVGLDLKLQNILVDGSTPLLSDFNVSDVKNLSGSLGSFVAGGTVPYIAPEVLRGEKQTPVTDIYCTGLLFYELLTGRVAHFSAPDIACVRADVSPWIADCVYKACDDVPARRYRSAHAFKNALDQGARKSSRHKTVRDLPFFSWIAKLCLARKYP
ncbi:serine/threonine protein kinase [Candidatus Woesearchaeota archaeon]|nr:serine/threonine protein kinase [Candidatus Woesearchaeota archaeon]